MASVHLLKVRVRKRTFYVARSLPHVLMLFVSTCLARLVRILPSGAELHSSTHVLPCGLSSAHFANKCVCLFVCFLPLFTKKHTRMFRHYSTSTTTVHISLPRSANAPSRGGQGLGVALHSVFVFFWIELIFGFLFNLFEETRRGFTRPEDNPERLSHVVYRGKFFFSTSSWWLPEKLQIGETKYVVLFI